MGFSNTLCSIPVDTAFNGVIFYHPNVDTRTLIDDTEINFINMRLEDTDGKIIDLQGVDWSITLEIDLIYKPTIDQKRLRQATKLYYQEPHVIAMSAETKRKLADEGRMMNRMKRKFRRRRSKNRKKKTDKKIQTVIIYATEEIR